VPDRLHRVAVLVLEGAKPLDVGIPAQVFTTRASMPYEVRVCGAAPGLVTGGDGLSYHVAHGLEALGWADIVFLPGYRHPDRDDPPAAVVEALLAAHSRGARLAAISTGAFALAATGLLDGKRATTHWHYTRALARRYPLIRVDENVLFVDEGDVLTSAGLSAAIDLSLHVIRADHGAACADRVARYMVAPPHRDGGQAQFFRGVEPAPAAAPGAAESLEGTRVWARERIAEPLTVAEMARHANVSPRTFARRFRAETGTTPLQWLLSRRVLEARRLLEESDLPVEDVALRVGFGNAASLRDHFRRATATTPTAYRRTFGAP
jgi:transcriptional regulator GlxA family with amidase domain